MNGEREQIAIRSLDRGRSSIVFLVRHFNDIDHMVPIVYKKLKDYHRRYSFTKI